MQQTPNCYTNTHTKIRHFFFLKPNGLKMPVKILLLWERCGFQVKSILLSLRTAYITQSGYWEIPHGPARALSQAQNGTNFKAEPPNYCRGNFSLNCERMTEYSGKQLSGARGPSIKILMNIWKLEIWPKTLLLLKLAGSTVRLSSQRDF